VIGGWGIQKNPQFHAESVSTRIQQTLLEAVNNSRKTGDKAESSMKE
jgi:hypothetical protein